MVGESVLMRGTQVLDRIVAGTADFKLFREVLQTVWVEQAPKTGMTTQYNRSSVAA